MTIGSTPKADATNEDAALVARIAAREEAAFREVIGMHAALLHRIAYRMTGDAHEAEDIAQEAMLRLWDHAPRLGQRGEAMKLGPWLKRVAMNLAFDRLRSRGRTSDADVPERVDEAPLADEALAAEEDMLAARALMEGLPERQRAAIVLTYYEELPNAEAAEVLEMKLKAFESLLFRARAALRSAFEANEAQGGAA
ncbi:sigma-70 family RNA polymerase sigma factor [Erythrobacter rubeus]|uniref:Sigma-70 family RNA polymerase sigma factor n=1 Tax=Erythrobacter rubeus TaxID=2760803 RepID=A0ABR8KS84_9SPHN|nr:sigma-70 family RNA polymerase sigma factor [Erythrobacter rubeus]MBD2842210.1 sigma-70 family RNA polymerase sigma factor [Erythrobacter rubeus]